jgi:hypothetical protein
MPQKSLGADWPGWQREKGMCLARQNARDWIDRCLSRRAAGPQGCYAKLEAVRRSVDSSAANVGKA